MPSTGIDNIKAFLSAPTQNESFYTNQRTVTPTIANNLSQVAERYPYYYFDRDNEETYGQYQTTANKWKNAGVKFLGLTGTTFLGGTVGLVNGVAEAVSAGDFSKFYDNSFTASLNSFSEGLEDTFANYTTQAYQNAKWYSPETWASANFWADTVFKNAGFSLGAILSGGAWGTVFKGLGTLAQGVSKGFGWGSNTLRTAGMAEDALTLSRQGQTVQQLQGNMSRIVADAMKNPTLANLGAYSQNLIRSTFAAAGEAQIEAYHQMSGYEKEAIREYELKHGYKPTGDVLEEIKTKARSMGDMTFGLNMGLLTASNLVMFPKIFGKSYQEGRKVVSDASRTSGWGAVVDVDGNVIKRGRLDKLHADASKGQSLKASGFGVNNAVQNSMEATKIGRVLNRVSPYATAIFSPREAAEEGLQYIGADMSEQFFAGEDDVKGSIVASFQKSLGNAMGDKEFWLGVMSGGISGGLMQTITPFNFGGDIKVARQNQKLANKMVSDINSSDLGGYTLELAASVVRGERLDEQATEALINGDRLSYDTYENDKRLGYILPRVFYGRGEMVQQEISAYRQLASTEEGLNQLLQDGKIEEGVSRLAYLEGLNQMERDFNTVSTVFEDLNTRFGQSYKQVGNKKVRTHNQSALMRMAYNASKIDYFNSKYNDLVSELSSNGIDTTELISVLSSTELSEQDNTLPSENRVTQSTEVTEENRKNTSSAFKEYVDGVRRYLESSGLYTADQIQDTLELIGDVAEITTRRRQAIDEYQLIRENPEAYNDNKRIIDEAASLIEDELDEEEKVKTEEDSITEKRKFFQENEGKPFTIDFGRRGTETGKLKYNPKNNILAIERQDGSLYEITNQDFKDGLVRSEDNSAIITESFLNEVDPRTEAKKQETRNNVSELYRNKKQEIDEIKHKIETTKQELQEIANELVDPTKAIDKLTDTFVMGQSILSDLEKQQADLEEQLNTYQEILDNNRSDYNTVVKDVEQQLSDVESLIGTIEQEKNKLQELLDYIKGVIKTIAERVKQKHELIQKTKPNIVSNMIVKSMDTILNTQSDGQTLSEQIDRYRQAVNALESSQEAQTLNERQSQQVKEKIQALNDRIDFLYDRLSNLDKVYDELLDRHYEIVEPILPEDFVDKDEAIKTLTETEDTTESPIENTQEDSIEVFEGKKKPLARYFNSTIVLDNNTLAKGGTEWNKKLQKALNNFTKLPAQERAKIKVMFLTPSNLSSFGLGEEVLDHLYGTFYKTREAMLDPDSGAVAVVFVKEDGGEKFFINERGNVLGKVGSSTTIEANELVYSKMTDTDLYYKVNRKGEQKQEAYVKPEEVSLTPEQLQEEYRKQRETILQSSELGQTYDFVISGGLEVDVNAPETSVLGNVLNKSVLSENEQVLTTIAPNTSYKTKNGYVISAKDQAVVLADTQDQATPLVVSNMSKERATALLNAILRFGRKDASDKRIVDFIRKTIPQKVNFDAENMILSKASEVIDLKPLLDSKTPKQESDQIRDKVITMFEKSKSNVSQPMMEPHVEFDANGVPTVFPTFQAYLLSNENGRVPVLFTNVAKNQKTNRYVTLQGFMQEWMETPQAETQEQVETTTTETEILTFLQGLSNLQGIDAYPGAREHINQHIGEGATLAQIKAYANLKLAETQQAETQPPPQEEAEVASEDVNHKGREIFIGDKKIPFYVVPTSDASNGGYYIIDQAIYDKWKEIDDKEKSRVAYEKDKVNLIGEERAGKNIKAIVMQFAAEKRVVLGVDLPQEIANIDTTKLQVGDEVTIGDINYKVTGFAFGKAMVSVNGEKAKRIDTLKEKEITDTILKEKPTKKQQKINDAKVNTYGYGATQAEAITSFQETGAYTDISQEDRVDPIAEEAQEIYDEVTREREETRQHAEKIKQDIRDVFGKHFENPLQTEAGIAILETLAESWANRNNTHADYFYKRFEDVAQSTYDEVMKEAKGNAQFQKQLSNALNPISALRKELPNVESDEKVKNSFKVKFGDTTINFSKGDIGVEVQLIETPTEYRGNQSARNAMNQFLEATDKLGIPTSLFVSPREGVDYQQLTNFYSSIGYRETTIPTQMERQPIRRKQPLKLTNKTKEAINEIDTKGNIKPTEQQQNIINQLIEKNLLNVRCKL